MKKKKKMFPYEGDDTPDMGTKQNYKVGFFNQMLNCAKRANFRTSRSWACIWIFK